MFHVKRGCDSVPPAGIIRAGFPNLEGWSCPQFRSALCKEILLACGGSHPIPASPAGRVGFAKPTPLPPSHAQTLLKVVSLPAWEGEKVI